VGGDSVNIAVLVKDVPDLVEDLELNDEGTGLAVDRLSFVPSEWDDQALEEALLLKEESGGTVTVVAIDTGDVDGLLYTALAKGADRAVKLVGDLDRTISNRDRARILADYLRAHPYDLVLTGVQAVDDVDGQVAGLVAGELRWPHAAVVRDVHVSGDGAVRFVQEYSGGRMAEFLGRPPLVLGVQAAQKPPRYVTVAKIRQTQKSATVEEVAVDEPTRSSVPIRRLYPPEAKGHAVMWDGDIEQVADGIVGVLREKNLVRGGN
jgi:electron transfer flavoprotein beta subunit